MGPRKLTDIFKLATDWDVLRFAAHVMDSWSTGSAFPSMPPFLYWGRYNILDPLIACGDNKTTYLLVSVAL